MATYYRKNISGDSGIYCIINKINNKRYIGQTYSIKNRFYRHKYELSNNKHHNAHLQNAWNKYGCDNFDFRVLEYCNIDLLNERETYWITYYDSFKNGYNQTSGDVGCRGYKHTQTEIAKMIKIQNPKAVIQMNTDLHIVKEWESASLASKTLKIYHQSIIDCCERKNNVKSVKGFIWIYKDDVDNIDYNYYLNKNISVSKKVGQFDKNMNLLKVCNSIYSIEKEFPNAGGSVSQVCNHKKNSYKGFIWAFVDDNGKPKDDYDYSTINVRQIRKIAQYDTNKVLIHIYNSIREVCKETGYYKKSISNACKNNTIYKNYLWKYID